MCLTRVKREPSRVVLKGQAVCGHGGVQFFDALADRPLRDAAGTAWAACRSWPNVLGVVECLIGQGDLAVGDDLGDDLGDARESDSFRWLRRSLKASLWTRASVGLGHAMKAREEMSAMSNQVRPPGGPRLLVGDLCWW